MVIEGEYAIGAPRQRVWEALNDPDMLRRCIPGCETLEQSEDETFQARIQSKIGPVKAKFNVKVSLENLVPPASYRLVGEGQGGVAGFARGHADVTLSEAEAGTTTLTYQAEFKIGGKLAQVGSRLVAGATRKTADQFFANFAAALAPAAAAPSEETADHDD